MRQVLPLVTEVSHIRLLRVRWSMRMMSFYILVTGLWDRRVTNNIINKMPEGAVKGSLTRTSKKKVYCSMLLAINE